MQAGQSEADQVKALGMAQQEMEYRVDLFNRCGGISFHMLYLPLKLRCAVGSYADLHGDMCGCWRLLYMLNVTLLHGAGWCRRATTNASTSGAFGAAVADAEHDLGHTLRGLAQLRHWGPVVLLLRRHRCCWQVQGVGAERGREQLHRSMLLQVLAGGLLPCLQQHGCDLARCSRGDLYHLQACLLHRALWLHA